MSLRARRSQGVAIHKLSAVSVGYFRKCVNLKSVSKMAKATAFQSVDCHDFAFANAAQSLAMTNSA